MTLEEWTQSTTIVGVIVAVITYLTTSLAQSRQRSIDAAIRYWDCHSGLFSPDSYIHANLKAMEAGTYKRDESDSERCCGRDTS